MEKRNEQASNTFQQREEISPKQDENDAFLWLEAKGSVYFIYEPKTM